MSVIHVDNNIEWSDGGYYLCKICLRAKQAKLVKRIDLNASIIKHDCNTNTFSWHRSKTETSIITGNITETD